jgi:hypothetical protein
MDEKTLELYLQVQRKMAQEREANTQGALKAGRFHPFLLENRDDRELWWDGRGLVGPSMPWTAAPASMAPSGIDCWSDGRNWSRTSTAMQR